MFVTFMVLSAEGSSSTSSHSIRISIQYPNVLSLKKSEIQWEIDHKQKKITIGRENESDEKIPLLQVKKCIRGIYSQQAIPSHSNIDFITAMSASAGNCKYDLSVIDKPNRDVKDCIVIFTITDIQ